MCGISQYSPKKAVIVVRREDSSKESNSHGYEAKRMNNRWIDKEVETDRILNVCKTGET